MSFQQELKWHNMNYFKSVITMYVVVSMSYSFAETLRKCGITSESSIEIIELYKK